MPDPIASRVDTAYRSMSSDDDSLSCKEGPAASGADSSQTERAAGRRSPAETSPASGVLGPHAEAHAEDGDLYAGAFALRGRDPQSGVEVEVFSASIHQAEREHAVQAGMARMGLSTDDGHFSARGEVFTAQAHIGFDNPDGSTGFGASIGATVVGAEVTGTLGPVSATGAASVGTTFGASIGVRDGDHDGKPELCGRVDFGVGGVGFCVEKRW